MDCPSEENLIRVKLGELPGIKKLEFDIPARILIIYHTNEEKRITGSLKSLGLGEKKLSTEIVSDIVFEKDRGQKKVLQAVLAINLAFFGIEMASGLLADSMGLVADSLDMLADAFVYGISLLAVGGSVARKKKIAMLAGYFQITLAIVGFIEVLRRFLGAEMMPDFSIMIIVSSLALIANAVCLYLLQRSKSRDTHMQASMIFTSNDVIINLGVIAAGLLVNWLNSGIPDLIIGSVVFIIVTRGAFRILKLAR